VAGEPVPSPVGTDAALYKRPEDCNRYEPVRKIVGVHQTDCAFADGASSKDQSSGPGTDTMTRWCG
jgi:hypothetical protein